MKRRTSISGFIVGAVLIGVAVLGWADDDFYKGKTIRYIVSSPPGGGYDLYSRLLARHLPKHIPGKPNVIVQNMPGGGHLIATRYLYSVAKKDGTVIGTSSRNVPHVEMFRGADEAKFESAKFNWLGSVTDEVQICAVRGDVPVKTLEDMQKSEKTLNLAGQAPGISPSDHARLLRDAFDAKVNVVDGYSGTGKRRLALETGETDGMCGWSWTSVKGTSQAWLDSGFLRPILQFGLKTHPELDAMNVPPLYPMAPNQEVKNVMKLFFTPLAMGRPVFTPPGVPKERVEILRVAFDETMKDPAFIKEAESLGLEVNPLSGKEVQQLVEELFAFPPEVTERAKKIVYTQ